MKKTVTEYDTQEVTKTVTDYETRAVENEQYVSDLTGAVIDEDELITLHANPEITHSHMHGDDLNMRMKVPDPKANMESSNNRCTYCKIKDDFDIRSGGEIHMSVSEFADLAGIDEESIAMDDDLPQAYVETAEPTVTPLIGDTTLGTILCVLSALQLPMFFYHALFSDLTILNLLYLLPLSVIVFFGAMILFEEKLIM